jgi:hypothetical protein
MKKIEFKHPDPAVGNVLLSVGDYIKTKWEWWGEIKEIAEIKHGQGLKVRRLNDNEILSVSDDDVIDFNTCCR